MCRPLLALIAGGIAIGWLEFTVTWAAMNGRPAGAVIAALLLFMAIAKTDSVYRRLLRGLETILDR
jgi:hypothetical protein